MSKDARAPFHRDPAQDFGRPAQRSGGKYAAVVFAFAAMALTGCGIKLSSDTPATTGVLTASTATIDFGSTTIGSAAPGGSVSFSNTSSKDVPFDATPLTGSEFKVAATTCGSSIGAGKSCSVTVTFTPSTSGTRTSSLSVASSGQTTSVTLRGVGVSPAALSLSGATVTFPDTVIGAASAPQQITLTNTGNATLPVTLTLTGNFKQTATTCAVPLAPQSACSATVSFLPILRGTNQGTLTATAGSTAVAASLTGNGLMPAHVQASPSTLEFPDTALQSVSSSTAVTVTNDGDVDAPLGTPTAPQDFTITASTCASALPAHGQCQFQIAFKPVTSGSKTGSVTLAAAGSTVAVAVSGSGYVVHHLVVSTSGATAARLQGTLQMLAQLDGTPTSAVTWSIVGTGAGTGSVSSTGLYTAPATMPANPSVTVRATLASDSKVTADLAVTLWNNLPVLQSASPAVVNPGAGTTVHLTGTGLNTIDSVLVDGVSTAVTKVSATEVTFVATPASWIVGPILLVAHMPGTGGGNSNALALAVNVPPVTYDAAVRFTQQVAMGTTADQIAQVQSRGFSKWIDWQLTTPMYPYQNVSGLAYGTYMNNTLNSNYALRQRVTMALKQVFTFGMSDACSMAECGHYWEARLQQDAFGNMRTLLYNVATSPMMGSFLQNVRNYAYYPWTGQYRANANFAREFMQLMTIGPYKLNRDGSQVLDSYGQPVPTYTEANVTDSAAAMSGWFWADHGDWTPLLSGNPLLAMGVVESVHDPLAKTILPGVTLPAGQGAVKDMNDVVDALFNHPNIGPFLCRRLIQHLVTSNPSPAYITRVVSVFENNGAGVRGDMGAVIKAILLDSEARRGDDPAGAYTQTETHFMEPVLYVASVVNALGVGYSDDQIYNVTGPLGEDLFMSATVFGAYSPENKLPTGEYAPEVQLMSDAASLQKVAFINNIVHGTLPGIGGSISGSVFWNAASSSALINQMDHFLFHGTMPDSVRTALSTYVSDHSGKTTNQMLPDMLLIALNSSAYQVIH